MSSSRLKSLKKPLPSQKPHNFLLGQFGEDAAVSFLLAKGWQVLARNFRCAVGELDIVAYDPSYREVVFVEVKTRAGGSAGTPTKAVDYRKRGALRRAATEFLKKSRRHEDFRFDIITVVQGKLEHFENITFFA